MTRTYRRIGSAGSATPLLLATFAAGVLGACGSGGDPGARAEALLKEAWAARGQANYDAAELRFSEARSLFERAERKELLWGLVDKLSEAKREAIRLVYDAEMEAREAAEVLGVPEGTVKSRLHHARKELSEGWRRLEQENGSPAEEET